MTSSTQDSTIPKPAPRTTKPQNETGSRQRRQEWTGRPGGRCSGGRSIPEAAGLERAESPREGGGRPGDPERTKGCKELESGPGKRVRGRGRPGLRPPSGAGRAGARLGRPPAPGAPPGTYHLGDLEAAERTAQVVGVAAQAGQPAALAHRLGGGLVRAAGARDHGGARGLALEAVQLLAAPHAAAQPGPPRAAGPRRPELAGSAGPPHRRRRLNDRPQPPRRRLLCSRRRLRPRLGPLGLGSRRLGSGKGGRRERVEREGGGSRRGGPGGGGASARLPAARRRSAARARRRWRPEPLGLGGRGGMSWRPALTCQGAGWGAAAPCQAMPACEGGDPGKGVTGAGRNRG